MISRWGSCQPKKSILTFNYALINATISCVEYVVVHEFVHFLVANHSRKFYEQISVFLPDWQERRELPKKIVPNVIWLIFIKILYEAYGAIVLVLCNIHGGKVIIKIMKKDVFFLHHTLTIFVKYAIIDEKKARWGKCADLIFPF